MFGRIFRKRKEKTAKQENDRDGMGIEASEPLPETIKGIKLRLSEIFSGCSDFMQREIICGNNDSIRMLVAYIDGLVDKRILNQDIIRPILDYFSNTEWPCEGRSIYEQIDECIVNNNDIKEAENLNQAIYNIVSGEAVLFIEGEDKALVFGVKCPKGRQVTEPDTEISIRGSREGFVEDLHTNMMLIRKRIKNSNLKLEIMQLGEQTRTDICIGYIKGIANEGIVKEVKERLKKIKTDGILDSGYIEQYISDNRYSLFPTVGNSEKCDKLAAKLLEGRVGIFCDGTPYVLTVPYLYIESLQATDDYYDHAFFATFMRLMRFLSLAVSNLLPGMYVALVGFHHTVIPFKLMITLASSRQGIPFSPFTEAVLMIVAFEFLREAGVRMPRPIGQSLSIVGAIVLGEASVSAGIASNLMVIIVALTATCSFVVPPLIRATMLLRFVFLLAAHFLGFLGISFVVVAIFIHLCRLRSFGIPYMAPFSPLTVSDLKDSLIIVPVWAMITRPKALRPQNIKRQKIKNI